MFRCYNLVGDNMLKFTKGFINDTNDKIATNYNKVNDVQKLDAIRKKLHPEVYNTVEEKDKKNNVDIQVIDYQSRINAMKNINKR